MCIYKLLSASHGQAGMSQPASREPCKQIGGCGRELFSANMAVICPQHSIPSNLYNHS